MTDLERITNRIATAGERAADARRQAAEWEKVREGYILEFYELTLGLKVGSIVRFKGVEYQVTSIDTRRYPHKPWLTALPKKKDGTWSKSARILFSDWEVVP